MSKTFNIHIPISKVDEEQRVVWGVATTEAIDSQGDVVDYNASKSAFSRWLGNIREMHQPIAVGKAIDIQYDDDNKQVLIGAKISESTDGENAWLKVKEGILNGFSIGGSVNKVVKEVAKKDGQDVPVTRIMDYDLSETSLVDNPANPEAMFVMVKSQKGGLQRVEHEASQTEITKAFAMPSWHAQFMLPMEKAQKIYDENMKVKDLEKGNDMKKSMYDAAWLLDLAIELSYYINSEQYEGDDVSGLQSALATIKEAVVKELNEPTSELTVAVELAQKTVDLEKAKESTIEKSTAVVGSEERDENAEVVATAEENGRPADDTEERAAEAEEVVEDVPADDKKDKAPAKNDSKSDEAEKAVTVSDLKKFTDGLITKLGDNKADFTKMLGELNDKVEETIEKAVSPLKDRISQLEDQPAASKAVASFVTIEKGENTDSEEVEVETLLKRRDELMANPSLGTPTERMELAKQLRKAQSLGAKIS